MGDHKNNPVVQQIAQAQRDAANQPRVVFGHQVSYFCGRQVVITHAVSTAGSSLNTSRGLMKNVTDGGVMMLQADGRHKLIFLGTIYSIEEAKVDQSLLAS